MGAPAAVFICQQLIVAASTHSWSKHQSGYPQGSSAGLCKTACMLLLLPSCCPYLPAAGHRCKHPRLVRKPRKPSLVTTLASTMQQCWPLMTACMLLPHHSSPTVACMILTGTGCTRRADKGILRVPAICVVNTRSPQCSKAWPECPLTCNWGPSRWAAAPPRSAAQTMGRRRSPAMLSRPCSSRFPHLQMEAPVFPQHSGYIITFFACQSATGVAQPKRDK